MLTKTRNSRYRKKWLAAAAALALAAPAFAQSWDGTAPGGATPNTFTPPASANSDSEAKAAIAANRNETQPVAFPPPASKTSAPALTPIPMSSGPVMTTQTPPPVWNVASPGTRAPEIPNNGERSMHEFGTGWKNFVNQKVFGVPPPPAAALSRPRAAPATPTARMDWNWQGYDTYNQRGEATTGGAAEHKGMHPEMAPYMKYAHLWRSSNNGFAQPVLPTADVAPASPMPLSNRGPEPSNWNGGSAPAPTKFAVVAPEKSPIQPTNFATIAAPGAMEPLPKRPSQFPEPDSVPRREEMRNGVPRSVRDCVADVCAGKARNVLVELVAPKRLRVAFRVRQQAEAEMLTEKLARLRELAPYRVDFEVQIGH